MPPYVKLISETYININIINNTSSLLKEPTLDNTYIVEPKLPSLLEMFYPSTPFPKVPLYVMSNLKLETEVSIPELPELLPLLLDTLKMDPKLEFYYLLELEKPLLDTVELPSVLLPEEEELINPS